MGTRSYYIFRYKNKWYVFYNHWDSYPSGLGQLIVDELKGINFEEMKELLVQINEESADPDRDGYNYKGLMCALKDPSTFRLDTISDEMVGIPFDIEYVYTINLDKNMFEVGYSSEDTHCWNTQRYRLDAIPEDWKDFVDE